MWWVLRVGRSADAGGLGVSSWGTEVDVVEDVAWGPSRAAAFCGGGVADVGAIRRLLRRLWPCPLPTPLARRKAGAKLRWRGWGVGREV